MQCPVCHSRRVGILNAHRYFCIDCAVEIQVKDESVLIYLFDEQGKLELLQEFDLTGSVDIATFSVSSKQHP